jgi:hypothetical protein
MDNSLSLTKNAIKKNLRPGIVLWVLLLVFWFLYKTNEDFNGLLQQLAELKKETGYVFSFVAYLLFAAVLPEFLKVIFFQQGKLQRSNISYLLYAGLVFGTFGIISDLIFSLQAKLFGESTDAQTLIIKTTVDQLIFSPFQCTSVLMLFMWKEDGFTSNFINKVSKPGFFKERLLPMYVAMWMVWIPGVSLVYLMPSILQLPVSSFILCFWSLIITFMSQKQDSEDQPQSKVSTAS